MSSISNPSSSFEVSRSRDATAAIRGYVYQVDTTILRWLQLKVGEELYLERGEDIDCVKQLWNAGQEEESSLLEQVKSLSSKVTLRTPSTLAALANCYDHREQNRGQKLVFRFTTNAPIGKERLSPLAGRGITVWNELRIKGKSEQHYATNLEGLRAIVKASKRPEDIPEQLWMGFQSFWCGASLDELFGFIESFEWSCAAPQSPGLRLRLQFQLIEEKFAANEAQSQAQYCRLFFYVFDLLTQDGIKLLSAATLKAQLILPTLEQEEQARLINTLNTLESRIGSLEGNLGQLKVHVEDLYAQVGRTLEIGATFDALANLELAIPLAAPKSAPRTSNVERLQSALKEATWLALHGGIGSGKTQLGIALASAWAGSTVWLRLQGVPDEASVARLDSACLQCLRLNGVQISAIQTSPTALYIQTARRLKKGTLWVFDHLPRLNDNDEMGVRLTQFAKALGAHGHRLFSTGRHPLPEVIKNLTSVQVENSTVPPMDSDEVLEFLAVLKAPQIRQTSQFARFICGLAAGHAWRLGVALEFLSQHNWSLGDDVYTSLLTNGDATNLNDNTRDLLRQTHTQNASLDLLLRLNLWVGSFAQEEVRVAASVKPEIPHPQQTFHPLIGPWVQKVGSGYEISPMIRALGSDDVPLDVRRACSLAFSQRIMKRRGGRLNSFDVHDIILHLHSGNDSDGAARFLAWGLSHLTKIEEGNHVLPERERQDPAGLLSLWWEAALPSTVSLPIRLLLRARQLLTGAQFNKDVTRIMDDLFVASQVALQESHSSSQSEVVAENIWSVFDAVLSAYPVWPERDFPRANQVSWAVVQALVHHPIRPSGSLPDGASPVMLVWWNVYSVHTRAHAQMWLECFQQCAKELRQRIAEHELAAILSPTLMEAYCSEISNKDTNQRRKCLEDLSRVAWEGELYVLWALATREQSFIWAESPHTASKALTLLQSALSQATEARSLFVIEERLGHLYSVQKQYKHALRYFDKALAEPTTSFSLDRLNTYIKAAYSASFHDEEKAASYTAKGVQFARDCPEIPPLHRVKVLGEHGVALWQTGDRIGSFSALAEGFDILLSHREDTSKWRALFTLYGHTCGYYAGILSTGKPPTHFDQNGGGETLARPTLTWFLNHAQIAGHGSLPYHENTEAAVPTQLSMMASALGQTNEATHWAQRGLEMARESGFWLPLAVLAPQLIPSLLNQNRFAEAMELALEAGALRPMPTSAPNLRPGLSQAEILNETQQTASEQSSYASLAWGLLPTFVRLMTIVLSDPEAAKRHSEEVKSLCKEAAAVSPDPQVWERAILIVECTSDDAIPAQPLVDLTNSYKNDSQVLHAIGYLGALSKKELSMKDRLRAHFAVIPTLENYYRSESFYSHILTPYVLAYWNAMLNRWPNSFSSLERIEQELAIIAESPLGKRNKRVLHAIGNQLSFEFIENPE